MRTKLPNSIEIFISFILSISAMFSSSGKNWYMAHAEETLVLYLSYNSGTKLRSTMEQQILKRSIGFQTGGEGREREKNGRDFNRLFLFIFCFICFFLKWRELASPPGLLSIQHHPLLKSLQKLYPLIKML